MPVGVHVSGTKRKRGGVCLLMGRLHDAHRDRHKKIR